MATRSLQIRAKLREIASQFVSYAVALSASSSLRRRVGNVDLMPKNCHGKSAAETQELFKAAAVEELNRVTGVLDGDAVRDEVEATYNKLAAAIDADSDDWKTLIPGKQVLAAFASHAGLSSARAKSLYIGQAARGDREPFKEIIELFDAMSV
jgi:hypothetical protein